MQIDWPVHVPKSFATWQLVASPCAIALAEHAQAAPPSGTHWLAISPSIVPTDWHS